MQQRSIQTVDNQYKNMNLKKISTLQSRIKLHGWTDGQLHSFFSHDIIHHRRRSGGEGGGGCSISSGRPKLIERSGLVSSSFRRAKIDDLYEGSFYMQRKVSSLLSCDLTIRFLCSGNIIYVITQFFVSVITQLLRVNNVCVRAWDASEPKAICNRSNN